MKKLEAATMAVTLTAGSKPHYIDVGTAVWIKLEAEEGTTFHVGQGVFLLGDIPVFHEQSIGNRDIKFYNNEHDIMGEEVLADD